MARASHALALISCMGPVTDGLYPRLADWLTSATGVSVECPRIPQWEDRLAALDTGEVTLGHICGTQYLPRAEDVEPLVAPVPAGERHQDRPVDFADIVVRSDAPFVSLDDLRGAGWAYNEPTAHSGFGSVAYALAMRGLSWDFFGEVIEAGSHDNALALVASGEVDGAAIDATMLPLSLSAGVVPSGSVRVLESLGPSPGPPIVCRRDVPADLRAVLREALAAFHEEPGGAAALREAGIARLASIDDAWYDELRDITRLGSRAGQPSSVRRLWTGPEP